MKKLLSRRAGNIFWLLVMIDVSAILFDLPLLMNIVKPLLMPALAVFLFGRGRFGKGKRLIIAGLFFSWLGDILLLPVFTNELFFIGGLICFLITHACYILYFLSKRDASSSFLRKKPLYFLLVLGYGAALLWILFPYLATFKIPVVVYTVFICSMLLCSVDIYSKVSSPANNYFILGALFFVLSDSLLAINKFYRPFPLSGIPVMLTYCTAQYFIVLGFIRTNDRLRSIQEIRRYKR